MMTPMRHGPDDWMRGLLGKLPRHEPPELTLEAIIDSGRRRARRRGLAISGGVLAAAAILLSIALGGDREPPVHLDIQIVDVPDPPDADTETAAWFAVPEEARNP